MATELDSANDIRSQLMTQLISEADRAYGEATELVFKAKQKVDEANNSLSDANKIIGQLLQADPEKYQALQTRDLVDPQAFIAERASIGSRSEEAQTATDIKMETTVSG